MSLYERFAALYAGLEWAHGVYLIDVNQKPQKGKVRGAPRTVRQPVTLEHYRAHLDGERGLGIVPIRDDGSVWWCAIDVDRYDVDLRKLAMHLRDTPFVVCRTKSGGAHLTLYGKTPQSARTAHNVLEKASKVLGFAGSEIFPKQTELREGDVGNWINLPYYDHTRTVRYALSPEDGRALTLEEFVDLAESRRCYFSDLRLSVPREEGDEFEGCPPCLERLMTEGFPRGAMNNGLFSLAVFAKRKFPDDWPERVEAYNERFMAPGSIQEVRGIVRSLRRRDYRYKCKDEPIASVCDRATCLTRRYGIRESGSVPQVAVGRSLRIDTDPPTFIIRINDVDVEMEVEDLVEQQRFRKRVLSRANIYLERAKEASFSEMVRGIVDGAERVDAPEDASPRGRFWTLVESFLTERPSANEKDELLEGRIWEDGGQLHFKATDLIEYLQEQRFREFTQTQVYALLRERGLRHKSMTIKGRYGNYWLIESDQVSRQTEAIEPPRLGGTDF